MIDRYLIRYFLAVLDHGTFTKAAQHCRVAQPTLSLGIAKLERELKHPLFNRNSRRVELTPAGVRFARFARRIEADFSNVEQEIADEPPSKLIRLGIATTIPVRWTGALLVAARTAAPSEQLEIVEGTVRELNAKLERGRIDLSFGPLPQSSSSHPVVDEGYRVAMPTHHPLAGRDVVTAEELAAETMIVRRHCEALPLVSRHFTERGVRPFMAARSTNDAAVLSYVRAGLGITVMPHSFITEGIAMPRLSGFDLRRSIGFSESADGKRTHSSMGYAAMVQWAAGLATEAAARQG